MLDSPSQISPPPLRPHARESPRSAGAPPRRVDRRVQEFRARVLEAAASLFAEQGVEATKIDEICELADVAKRTLCNHFPTKADIVQALSREAVLRLVSWIDDARDSGRSNRERLRLLFDRLRADMVEVSPFHRESVGAFFHVAHGTLAAADGEQRLSVAMRSLLEAGGPHDLPVNASLDTFTELVLGAIYSTTLEWIHRDDYDREDRTAEIGGYLVSLLPESPPAAHGGGASSTSDTATSDTATSDAAMPDAERSSIAPEPRES